MAWDKIFGRGGSAPAKNAADAAAMPAASATDSASETKRQSRRSKRVFISIGVLVKFQRGSQSHEEEVPTEAVNAHGCLLRLSAVPEREQKLVLVNLKSGESAECRVAYVGHSEGGKTKVGIEFLVSAEHFWHIAFPPDGWNPADFRDSFADATARHLQRRL